MSQELGQHAAAHIVPAITVQTDEDDQPITMAPQTVQLIRPLPVPIDMPAIVRPLPVPMPVESIVRPARHDSLPPSPKPDAEVPVRFVSRRIGRRPALTPWPQIDEEIRFRDKFSSGVSIYSMSPQSNQDSPVVG